MKEKRTATFELLAKEPDVFWQLAQDLKLGDKARDEYFVCGEYARIELEVDATLEVVGGRFLKVIEW